MMRKEHLFSTYMQVCAIFRTGLGRSSRNNLCSSRLPLSNHNLMSIQAAEYLGILLGLHSMLQEK
eukprot:2254402-Amphidinium_carterae.1